MGKSSLAKSIAEALGRRFADLSCNGMRQASDMRGEHRSWTGAQPGRIIRQLRSVGARNPVFVLDELDKIGEVAGVALLDALDPTRNAAFHDHYLEVPFDLSEVFFIATANALGRIPTALRNRLEVIEIAGYSEAEKLEIARRILVPARILARPQPCGLGALQLEDAGRPPHRAAAVRRGGVRPCPHDGAGIEGCCRTRESDRFEPGADPKMFVVAGASSDR